LTLGSSTAEGDPSENPKPRQRAKQRKLQLVLSTKTRNHEAHDILIKMHRQSTWTA